MSWNDRTINTLNLIVALIAIGVTIILAVYTNSPGANAPKQLSAQFAGPTDPLSDLETSPADITVEMKSGGKPLQKIYLFQTSLKNTGTTPVLPGDFFGNIEITTSEPWAIVAVGNARRSGPQSLTVPWSKVSDVKVSAPPTLINPGDNLVVTVYVTAPEKEVEALKWDSPAPIRWNMRVVNMPAVAVELSPYQEFNSKQGPIIVYVWGWGVPFLAVMFLLSFWLHLTMAVQIKAIAESRVFLVSSALVSALISLCSADAITTYVFGLYPGLDVPVDHWANVPPIVLNMIVVSILTVLAFKKPKEI